MFLADTFSDAVLEGFPAITNKAGAVPELIARASVQVLPVAGAGVTFRAVASFPLRWQDGPSFWGV